MNTTRGDVRGRIAVACLLASARAVAAQPAPHGATSAAGPVAEEWYLPVAGGCTLYVYEVGAGPDTAIVLHGGFGAEHAYMLDAVRGLEDRHHFVFYDQRGSLRSPCPDSLVSLAAHVVDLDAVRAAVGMRRATLVGHSMGTLLAMVYLQRFPERVRGVVLTGAVPSRTPAPTDSAREAGARAAVQEFLTRPAMRDELHRAGVAGDPATLGPKQQTLAWRIRFAAANVYHVERWRAVKGGRVFYHAAAGRAAERTIPPAYDFTPVLARHVCAVTVILGDHDFVDWGGARHGAWTHGAPGVTFVLLREAGHNAWLDAPAMFRTALGGALDRAAQCTAL